MNLTVPRVIAACAVLFGATHRICVQAQGVAPAAPSQGMALTFPWSGMAQSFQFKPGAGPDPVSVSSYKTNDRAVVPQDGKRLPPEGSNDAPLLISPRPNVTVQPVQPSFDKNLSTQIEKSRNAPVNRLRSVRQTSRTAILPKPESEVLPDRAFGGTLNPAQPKRHASAPTVVSRPPSRNELGLRGSESILPNLVLPPHKKARNEYIFKDICIGC